MNQDDKTITRGIVKWITVCIVVSTIVTIGCCAGCPIYGVWQKGLKGKAELKQAEYNRKIKIREAEAKHESAKSLAMAEVERAKGVAKANKIIGESLRKNEAYLRYLWIQGLHNGKGETIYIPTEANLPILEATRRKVK
jgi:hypothetical protein